jgi:diguanylate cyclase (GGDEF)-like protein
MIEKATPNMPELSDHETFRQTIIQLDRSLTRTWRSTTGEIAIVLAAIVAPIILGNEFPGSHLEITLIVDGFLLLMLACNTYGLVQYNQLKQIRNRLTVQLEISIKQHIRADKLYGLSILDPLTGLHNRRFGEDRLEEEIARAERNGDPLAVIILDLDHFKEINDQFGHAAGDVALKEFSRRLRKAIRACDVPVRIGGDEFLVILPECPREKVNVILSRLGSPEVEINSQKLSICYSVGRSQYQVHDTIKTLLGRADDVLYAEKEARTQTSLLPEASKRSALAMRNQGRAVPLSSGRTAAMAEVDGAAYS